MNDFDAIQASLSNFTKRLDEAVHDRENELRKCSFFDPIPSECLDSIAIHADIITFNKGDKLTVEGEDMDSFFVILFGSVTAYYKEKMVGSIRSGECIGEGVFFATETLERSATVIADNQVVAAEIKKTGLDHIPPDARAYMDKALLLALFKKLQGANRKIEDLLRYPAVNS
ncbi:MAG: cyclic nucleotide-binding domain-containing protein [Sideroxydans sp.]|nr:cyclic nucleotide-binding domain-containing protein [Sideroxydans sp.]NOT97709.1 cyclic nucleotide-binding domain-containing protein [Sideroxydans sp.]